MFFAPGVAAGIKEKNVFTLTFSPYALNGFFGSLLPLLL